MDFSKHLKQLVELNEINGTCVVKPGISNSCRCFAPRGRNESQRPSITTPRLILRPWRQSDRPLFAEQNADPEVMTLLEWRPFPAAERR